MFSYEHVCAGAFILTPEGRRGHATPIDGEFEMLVVIANYLVSLPDSLVPHVLLMQ